MAARSPRSICFASDLFGGGQERVAAHLGEEELERVRRPAGAGRQVELGIAGYGVFLDLDVGLLERSAKRAEGLLVEIVLGLQGVDLRRADEAALLRVLDEGGNGRARLWGAQGQFSHRFSVDS